MASPPCLPTTSIYTSQWCEENIYLLVKIFNNTPHIAQQWHIYAVFISNTSKSVALWEQKLAKDHGYPVVWDYHVVMILRPSERVLSSTDNRTASREQDDPPTSWVYDFDTCLPMPCPFRSYMSQTFRTSINPKYQSMFRVVPAHSFLANFASDRSHMLVQLDEGDDIEQDPQRYHALPPSYPPILGGKAKELGVVNNLMASFVSMTPDNEEFGEIMEFEAMLAWGESKLQ